MKDYGYKIGYYPRKANVVVDALSRKSSSNLAYISSNSKKTYAGQELN